MTRIEPVNHATAEGKTKTLLDGVQKAMGGVPNIVGTLAQGPAALEAYLGFSKALSGSTLPGGLREQIALTVAGANGCDYCAAAHTALGKNAGVDDAELERSLVAESSDPKTQAALVFSKAVVANRGWVGDADLENVRAAGFTDGDVIEIVATVVLNILTNYVNHVAGTAVDFPAVAIPEGAAV